MDHFTFSALFYAIMPHSNHIFRPGGRWVSEGSATLFYLVSRGL